MAKVLNMLAAVFLVVVALGGAGIGVSAETHHVVGEDGGWGPSLNVTSWLLGRVFRVGDKIWFKYSGTEDNIVELKDLEEFLSCNLTNPIRMYTEHVALEEEGVRYFSSGDPKSCKNGLKLPVPVQPQPLPQPLPVKPPPHVGPPVPVHSPPPHVVPPLPVHPPPHVVPPLPVHPPPAHGPSRPFEIPPGPPIPFHPPPRVGPPPPPKSPSAAAHLNGLSFVLIAGLLISYMGI